MKYYSLHKKAPKVSFKEAVIKGLAPDMGLYFPEDITPLKQEFISDLEHLSKNEIAFQVIEQFVGNEIPELDLKNIIADVLNFNFPLVPISENISTLELFHGPTMAFKDVGARFMARCLSYFNQQEKTEQVTILVATSGDTGGAVASGFLGVKGVNVIILYPSGKVSEVQEKQLTTLGKNITALEVKGTFDDCQKFVKTAFIDKDIIQYKNLTSANSINIARWLPQMFYYFFAYKQLKNDKKSLTVSVPSGNFGNICAGLLAQKLGLPIEHFIAATNVNDCISDFLKTGFYKAKPTIQTISNAMDVGDPSNFVRILEIFDNNTNQLKNQFSSFSFTDDETRAAIKELYLQYNYTADPHGAVGYLGLKKYIKNKESQGIFLETAHPVKFLDIVEPVIEETIPLPPQIEAVITKEKKAVLIDKYEDLKHFLLQ